MPGDSSPPVLPCQRPRAQLTFLVPGHGGQRLLLPSGWCSEHTHTHRLFACFTLNWWAASGGQIRVHFGSFVWTAANVHSSPQSFIPPPNRSLLPQWLMGGCVGGAVACNNVQARLDCNDWGHWLWWIWFIDQSPFSNVASEMRG